MSALPAAPRDPDRHRRGRWWTGFNGVATILSTLIAVITILQWVFNNVAWAVLGTGLFTVVFGVAGLVHLWPRRSTIGAVIAVAAVAGGAALGGGAVVHLAHPGIGVDRPGQGGTSSLPRPEPSDTPVPPSVDPPPTSSPSPEPSQTPSAPETSEVPREKRTTEAGKITLNGGYSVDLDSDAADWGITRAWWSGRDLFLWDGFNQSLGLSPSSDIVVLDGPPDYTACVNATDLRTSLPGDQLRKGRSFCLRQTTGGSVAWITIDSVSEDPYQLVLEVTVWEPTT